MTGCDHPWATQDEIGRPYCQACGEPWEQVRKERAMNHPHARPCQSGPCTEKGLSTPGFCKCKADAAEIDRLQEAKRVALKLADERAKEANGLRQVLEAYEDLEANLILTNKCWSGQNVTFTDDLWDRFLEIQAMRNKALGRF